jgi:hypothetical protein
MNGALRDMPIITATLHGRRWLLGLPAGDAWAEDDVEAVRLVSSHAPGSAIRWITPAFRSAPDLAPVAGNRRAGTDAEQRAGL